jgi:5-methylcytosine-specific restriction endonuclease McrA
MKRSCKHCGTYHEVKFDCGRKPSRQKKLNAADKFRKTNAWRKKSLEIRQRDKSLCQVCIRQLYNTTLQYNFETIEVHHIIKLEVDMSKKLDNEWLLSMCKYHHTMADDYQIPMDELHEIAMEQEKKNNY